MTNIERSLAFIKVWLAVARAPVVAWSGGLDSQVLLHLVRQIKADVPLWQARIEGTQRGWQDEFVIEHAAELWHTRPVQWAWVSDGTDVDLVAIYELNERQRIQILFAIAPADTGCVQDVVQQVAPRHLQRIPFDVVFTGQRRGDEDGWGNQLPEIEQAQIVDYLHLVHPLLHWTRAEIEAYADAQQLRRGNTPQDGQVTPLCVRCITGNGATVTCPKTKHSLKTEPQDYAASLVAWQRILTGEAHGTDFK